MILTALLSLLAGVITVLTPCVLPFIPVIVGGSLTGDRRRPFVVAASLLVSLLAFTFLLKVSTVFISLDPRVWMFISGGLVIILGVLMLFPSVWSKVSMATGLERQSHKFLDTAKEQKSPLWQSILTGVALGPVFSSCSPTYAWVISTILPVSTGLGLFYLSLYSLAMVVTLLVIALAGRKLVAKLRWAANPRGWFQRTIAIIFIIVGVMVATGLDQRVQTWSVAHLPGLEHVEKQLVPKGKDFASDDQEVGGKTSKSDGQGTVVAPEIRGITHWINSKPLTLKQLRGKVVLIDFWTYSCINCIRTQPYLNAWYKAYKNDGLVIIGVHAPEFSFEKVPANVERAVKEEHIEYPVAMDNNYATWRAYYNRYWPAKYLIDQDGKLRYTHFGEGNYAETENMIKKLLRSMKDAKIPPELKPSRYQSPETYLGIARARGFRGEPRLDSGSNTYKPQENLRENEWTLSGKWKVDDEKITSQQAGSTLTYKFLGRDVYLVMDGPAGAKVKVTLEGADAPGGEDVHNGTVTLDYNRLYRLVKRDKPDTPGVLHIEFPAGVSANAFTFG